MEEGAKGHFSQQVHRQLLTSLIELAADIKTSKVLLADGEFDGTGLLTDLRNARFEWVLRTSLDRKLKHEQETFVAHQVSGGVDSSWYIPDCQLSDGTCRAAVADALCKLAFTHSPQGCLFANQF